MAATAAADSDDPLAELRAKVAQALRARGDIEGAERLEAPRGPAVRSPREPPPDYEVYRRGALWRRIKARVLERDGHTCRRCGGRAAVVHHRLYTDQVLAGEADEWLVSVCDGCHTVVHYDEAGRWRSWDDQEAVLATSDLGRSYPPPKIDFRRRQPETPPGWDRMNAHQRAGWSREAGRRFYAGKVLRGGRGALAAMINLCLVEGEPIPAVRDDAWRESWTRRAAEIVADYRAR